MFPLTEYAQRKGNQIIPKTLLYTYLFILLFLPYTNFRALHRRAAVLRSYATPSAILPRRSRSQHTILLLPKALPRGLPPITRASELFPSGRRASRPNSSAAA
jgi:hypothetical protein